MSKWVYVLLLACVASARDMELKHDDGKQAGKRSSAGTGHVVTFLAPRGKWWIKSVAVHGARYGGGYDPAGTMLTITVGDKDLKKLSVKESPYAPFKPGRFEWVELPVTPVQVPKEFTVCVEFNPTRTKGVFVAWCKTKKSHSGWGVPGTKPIAYDNEWMIRVRLTNKKPKGAMEAGERPRTNYKRDFDFVVRKVRIHYPSSAIKKKGIDYPQLLSRHAEMAKGVQHDILHMFNIRGFLAGLKDSHTGVLESKVDEHGAFDGLFGAGLWIAVDGRRYVVRASLRPDIVPGTELLEIDGKPVRRAHSYVQIAARILHGWSSDHFLDARLSFQFFPFGDKQTLDVKVLEPDGDVKTLKLQKWGPGGKGLSRIQATLPDGVAYAAGATSAKLAEDMGYIRITGSMNESTRKAFFAAFDKLKGVRGIVLDCRGMGGGSDRPAWAMAGRFAPKGIAKTGDWQFEGPVVMLQDERMISSAETFTWAIGESGRAVTVGRPTGGATIIPKVFTAPSGLFRFRVGSHDRRTPFLGVRPEGVGSPPDIYVPYELYLLQKYGDPTFGVGLVALKRLIKGEKRDEVIKELKADFGCDRRKLTDAILDWEDKLHLHGHGDWKRRKRAETLQAHRR